MSAAPDRYARHRRWSHPREGDRDDGLVRGRMGRRLDGRDAARLGRPAGVRGVGRGGPDPRPWTGDGRAAGRWSRARSSTGGWPRGRSPPRSTPRFVGCSTRPHHRRPRHQLRDRGGFVPEDGPVNTSRSAEAPRVLVVDDEAPLARVVASYLEREGFAVDLAHDGPTAVTAAREHLPDLVVLDVMLPGFDGIEVCRQIRTLHRLLRDHADRPRRGDRQGPRPHPSAPTTTWSSRSRPASWSPGSAPCCAAPAPWAATVSRARSRPPPRPPQCSRSATSGVDLEARVAWVAGAEVELTRTEFDLLAALVERTAAGLQPPAADRRRVGVGLVRRRAHRRRARRAPAPQARRRRHQSPATSAPCAASATGWPADGPARRVGHPPAGRPAAGHPARRDHPGHRAGADRPGPVRDAPAAHRGGHPRCPAARPAGVHLLVVDRPGAGRDRRRRHRRAAVLGAQPASRPTDRGPVRRSGAVAAGRYDITVPRSTFSRELSTLADAFQAHGRPARPDRYRPQPAAGRPRPRDPHPTGHPRGPHRRPAGPGRAPVGRVLRRDARPGRPPRAAGIRHPRGGRRAGARPRPATAADSGDATSSPRAVRAAEARYQAAGVTLTCADCRGVRHRSRSTRTASSRYSATCSTTPCATPRPAVRSTWTAHRVPEVRASSR